ncbi:uncharacterized protein LOC135169660 [Diachasmimorpha longicaudata]|uniref:uncharacterized protein LOC135169660 n=1 Tax=Diachasmimorpha longicaudata TaxID=58733 RepID=UPI0030B8DBDE
MIFNVFFTVLLVSPFIYAGPVRVTQQTSRAISVSDDASAHVPENLEDLGVSPLPISSLSNKELSRETQTGFPILPGFNGGMLGDLPQENSNKIDVPVRKDNTKPNPGRTVDGVSTPESQTQINEPGGDDDEDSEDDVDWAVSEEESQEQGPVSQILNGIADLVEEYFQSVVDVGGELLGSDEDQSVGDDEASLL